MIDTIRVLVTAPWSIEATFHRFTEEMERWWPREYSWGGDALEWIGITPREGGSCFEIGPHGFRCDWGQVLSWEPPARVVFTWQISPRREPVPDRAKSSVVEVSFAPTGMTETEVALRHSDFSRHGEGAAEYRAAMASAQGWPHILGKFVSA